MYPDVIGRGSGFVITDNHSGGISFPRHPRGSVRVAAQGRGIRSNRYGFERDSGNRIPTVDPVAYRDAKGSAARTVEQPRVLDSRLMETVAGPGTPKSPGRGRAKARRRANSRAKKCRAAQKALSGSFNAAIKAADIEVKREETRIHAAARREWQLAFSETATRLDSGVR